MRITFTGDILCYKSQDKGVIGIDGKRDYKPIFENIKPLLSKSDYVVGSFETITAGLSAKYTHSDTSFNTPDEILMALKWAGVDLLTTANNHCFDRGIEGHHRTIDMISLNGLEHTGTYKSPNEENFLIKDFEGTRIAFIAYTYGTNSRSNGFVIPNGKEYLVNLTRPQDTPIHRPLWKRIVKSIISGLHNPKVYGNIQEDCVNEIEINNGRNVSYEKKMIETIRNAKSKSDIVIMCLHSGGQFNSKIGTYTQHLFNIIADAGADVIICNHAHTILPIYRHNDCLVASALGNFSFAPGEGYWVDGVMAEYSALFHLDISNKKIENYSVSLCQCIKNNKGLGITTPMSTEDNKYNNVMKRLFHDENCK